MSMDFARDRIQAIQHILAHFCLKSVIHNKRAEHTADGNAQPLLNTDMIIRVMYRDSELYYCMPSPLLEVDILFRF